MFEMMSLQALVVGAERRREVAASARKTRGSAGMRQAVGLALVTVGQRVAGEMPAMRAASAEGDCA